MANSVESKSSSEKKGWGFNSETLKRLNKLSAFTLGAAGVITGSEVLLGLALVDVGQIYLVNRYQAERAKGNSIFKSLGNVALGSFKPKPAPA